MMFSSQRGAVRQAGILLAVVAAGSVTAVPLAGAARVPTTLRPSRIVGGVSIASFRLGEAYASITHQFGAAAHCTRRDDGSCTPYQGPGGARLKVFFVPSLVVPPVVGPFVGSVVISAPTAAARRSPLANLRTRGGIGVGSDWNELRRAERSLTPVGDGEYSVLNRSTGDDTTFDVHHGVVTGISVGVQF